jgi:ribose transport system substrate-binding protein
MKKLLVSALIVIIGAALLIGCGGTGSSSKKIGLAISTLNNPFFVTLKEGAEAKAKELGYELVVTDAQDDPAKQAGRLMILFRRRLQLFFLIPAIPMLPKQWLKRLQRQKFRSFPLTRGEWCYCAFSYRFR